MNILNSVHIGDCRDVLPQFIDQGVRVNCVMTSIPYYGLRDYGVDGQLGHEATPELFVAEMVRIFNLVRQVMAPDATLWLNVGDSYAGSGGAGNQYARSDGESRVAPYRSGCKNHSRVKPKSLWGIPWRLALAMIDDGWILRNELIWAKSISGQRELSEMAMDACLNEGVPLQLARKVSERLLHSLPVGSCAPESASDRFTRSHEQVFLFATSSGAFCDMEPLREPASHKTNDRGNSVGPKAKKVNGSQKIRPKQNPSFQQATDGYVETRNRRSVHYIPTGQYKGIHTATFPPELIRPYILAGTSQVGHCSTCGKGWRRIVERGEHNRNHQRRSGSDKDGDYHGESAKEYGTAQAQDPGAIKRNVLKGMCKRRTVGWKPTCECEAHIVPGIVFDPFMGSGTVGMVAANLGRDWIGIELNPDYLKEIEERTAQPSLSLNLGT